MIALAPADARYPVRLRDLARPPDPLWIDGDVAALREPAVAIVGTRRMTGYGERVARELASAAAAAGLVVVSGFAQGIDSAAHRGALDAGGRTVAVLGESIAAFVRSTRGRRRPLVPRVRASGALVSEYASPLAARPWMFAKRNGTIAALAAAVVVVEAPETSGALITAAHARSLGRVLFAVPGPLGSIASVGTNRLIAAGDARALTRHEDVLDAVGATARPAGAATRGDDAVVALLGDGALGVDEIARRLRTTPQDVARRAALPLLRGELIRLPDGRLARA